MKNGNGRNVNEPSVSAKRTSAATAVNHRMNLHLLIPTLRLSCSVAVAHYDVASVTNEAALVLGFDSKDNPQVFYVADTNSAKCPAHIVYAAVIVGESLHQIIDIIIGMGLTHEQAVEKLTNDLIPNLAKLLYCTKQTDDRLLKLANILDQFAITGITTGITAVSYPPKKAKLKPCEYPERN